MRLRGNEFGIFKKNICGSVIYYFWVYHENGKRRFRSTGKRNFDEAVKFCRTLQVKGQLYSETSPSFSTYSKVFFDYEKCPYINHRLTRGHTYGRSWAKRQKQLLEKIIRPYFGMKALSEITFKDIDSFILLLKDQNCSNKKINHIISTLKNLFWYAEKEKTLEINPCIGLKPFKIISPEKGILTKEEIASLFSNENRNKIWPETMHFLINYIAAFTGLRLGEILALRPQDFSDSKLIVSNSFSPDDGLKCTKNGKSRYIPLDKKLEALLMDCCQGKRQDEFIFSINNGISPVVPKTIYKRFWKAREYIGIDEVERKRRNISFHSFRHGVNTMLLEAGVVPERVQLLLGHSGSSMTARYAHLQLPNVLRIYENLNISSKENENYNITKPEYVKALINKELLLSDVKTVTKSLNVVTGTKHTTD